MGKSLAILGSTGSIGQRTLDVVKALDDSWSVAALTAGSNWKALAAQAKEFLPKLVAIADERHYRPLKASLSDLPIEIMAGQEGILAAASLSEADFVVCAIVGSASVKPAFAAVRAGKNLGLASKEALVVTGELLLSEARRNEAKIIPVDSEHSAVFQAAQAGDAGEILAITLTASGGPFLNWPTAKVRNATLVEALAHPTWSMGKKISIDSATMMNKALEVIEAHYLFNLSPDRINVLIHPESIVHALVEFCDGSMVAHMSEPDMAIAIQYALTWPDRMPGVATRLDLAMIGNLTFIEANHSKFPALDLAYEAARAGGAAPAVLNGANEQAVSAFIAGKINFGQIVDLTREVLNRLTPIDGPSLDDLLELELWARNEVNECLKD